jgi:hypothetical protein
MTVNVSYMLWYKSNITEQHKSSPAYLRLEVAVHNATLVHVRHGRDKLPHDGRRLWLREVFLLPDAVKQFTSTEQLHHYVSVQLYTIFTHTHRLVYLHT